MHVEVTAGPDGLRIVAIESGLTLGVAEQLVMSVTDANSERIRGYIQASHGLELNPDVPVSPKYLGIGQIFRRGLPLMYAENGEFTPVTNGPRALKLYHRIIFGEHE